MDIIHGKFISIEGIEGAGKSTAIAFIQDYFAKKNIPLVMTREPGGTPLAEEIRKLLLFPASAERMEPDTELLLMFAGRAQHIKQCIMPALNDGKWVVSDRFVDASYAYQGGGRSMNLDTIKQLDKLTVGSLYPDLTLLLDIPTEQGLARADKRGSEKDRIEKEKVDFFDRVRDVYLERAKQDPERIKIIDASLDIASVQAQIQKTLDAFI